MAESIETTLARAVAAALDGLPNGAEVPESEAFRKVLLSLTRFVPLVLWEIHPEKGGLNIDDVYSVAARKTGPRTLELLGVVCYVADQTHAPLHLKLRVAAAGEGIDAFEVRLDERSPGRGRRETRRSLRSWMNRLGWVGWNLTEIDWEFHAGFGTGDSWEPSTPDKKKESES